MIEFLIGIMTVILIAGIIYLLGLLPNLWSDEIIHPTSIPEAWVRGVQVLFCVVIFFLFIWIMYEFGGMIISLL